jgi:serine/threonine protein kinase
MGPLLGERYQVVHPVWRDRLGETHVARDERTGCPVVVRLLRGELATRAVARRMHEEYGRLVGIRDPHLAGVLDLVEGDVLAIVTEAVEGRTLRQRLRAGAPSAGETATIGAGVAAALEALHEGGLAHGRVDPADVVLSATGAVRLTEVGLAHLVAAAPAGREALRAGPAPELAESGVPTPATDMYALGALLAGPARGLRPSPAGRLSRRLRARDPGARPSAHEARVRLQSIDAGPEARPTWRGLARAR